MYFVPPRDDISYLGIYPFYQLLKLLGEDARFGGFACGELQSDRPGRIVYDSSRGNNPLQG